MIEYGVWLAAGVAIGMTFMAFLAIGTFQRGYEDGYRLRRPWRAELVLRRAAAATAVTRETNIAAASRLPIPPAIPLPIPAASSG